MKTANKPENIKLTILYLNNNSFSQERKIWFRTKYNFYYEFMTIE